MTLLLLFAGATTGAPPVPQPALRLDVAGGATSAEHTSSVAPVEHST
jgi:hypothetical protein